MKKLFLLAMTFLWCSPLHPLDPEKVETLSAKFCSENKGGYYVLADDSCWKVIGFSKRWRGLREWWNNVQLAPETYDCIPDNWIVGATIEIYQKSSFPSIPLENASNKENVLQCSHVFLNKTTNQVLFAIALKPAECLTQLYKLGHNDGYEEGHSKGRHERNHQEYQRGYQEGVEKIDQEYKRGYRLGYQEGYNQGSRHQSYNNEPSHSTRPSTGYGTTITR